MGHPCYSKEEIVRRGEEWCNGTEAEATAVGAEAAHLAETVREAAAGRLLEAPGRRPAELLARDRRRCRRRLRDELDRRQHRRILIACVVTRRAELELAGRRVPRGVRPRRKWLFSSDCSLIGTVKQKTVPRGSLGFAQSRPPCTLMIERQIDKPKPKPFPLVV